MKTINLVQGSDAWHSHRAKHFNASDAAAMMGASSYVTRNELLHRIATGYAPDVSEFQQALFDRGHAAEAAARPVIESLIGDELFPATAISDIDPRFSASFDGVDMEESTGFECKLWNEALVAQVRAGEITDPAYYWQLEHQLFVGNLQRIIFAVATEDGSKVEHLEYKPVAGRREQLLAGWEQFAKDLAAYTPEAPKAEAVASPIMALPALSIQLIGEVKSSNLVAYKQVALNFIASINTDLATDQDFADAEGVIKFCDKAEKELDVVKKQALSQTASIDQLFRAVDEMREAMRAKRLELDKLVKARKEAIRLEILAAANKEFADHVAAINKRLARVTLPPIPANFPEAIKGKKTVTGLRDGVGSEMARAKIEANAAAEKITANLATFDALASEHAYLFRDLQQLIIKDGEAVEAIITSRIAEHKAAEAKRLEAERERIAQLERARIERQEGAKIAREILIAADERAEAEAREQAAAAAPAAPSPVGHSAVPTKQERPTDDEIIAALAARFRAPEIMVIKWLGEIDLFEAAERASEQLHKNQNSA